MIESRLSSPSGVLEREPRRVAAHAARRLDGKVLVVSDSGEHVALTEEAYSSYLAGDVAEGGALFEELAAKDLLRDRLDFPRLAQRMADRFLMRWPGPGVHTVVVTRRCNFKCVYCHASVVRADDLSTDMTVESARAAVDLAFRSHNPELTIEFQGGEPLLNWPVVKFIVEYARLKNVEAKKTLHFGLISNFSLLDDEKLDWLAARGVSFCTSLDGPRDLHDANRLWLGGPGHERVVAGLKAVLSRRAAGVKVDVPNAITTVSRASLSRAKDIVDEIVGLGIERVQLGPLDPIGFARRAWDKVGYEPEQFVEFYGEALDHLIALNRKGVKAYEKMALVLLVRVLRGEHWRFPFADGVARLAYDWDGSVYTGEDGRLLAADGDPFFRVGSAQDATLDAVLEAPVVRAGLLAASPWSQPMCFQCAYAPFCTVQPVHNHATQGSLWGQTPSNRWCRTIMGVFDQIFRRLQNPEDRKVLESWLDYKER